MAHYGTAPVTYRIAINPASLNSTAPSDGFIDNTKMATYITAGGSQPNLAQTVAKFRGNSRFEMLLWGLQQSFNIALNPTSIVATGGSSTAAPSTFQFDITVRSAEVALTADESNAGQTLSGTACIRRLVARTLMVARTDRGVITDPTESAVKTAQDNATANGARRGETISDVTVGALATVLATAESAVTVTVL